MIELSHIYKTFEPGTINESVLFTDFNLSIHNDDFISSEAMVPEKQRC